MLPAKRMTINIVITVRVFPAFLDSGGLKAGTPLLMASIPVRAVQPVAKVWRIKKRVKGCVAGGATVTMGTRPWVDKVINPYTNIGR